MSGFDLKVEPRDVGYLYDSGLAGFFCCVHESVYQQELPYRIEPEHNAQPSLFPSKYIPTDAAKAARVRASIPAKISPRALQLAENVFLSCMRERELALLRFLLLGYTEGGRVTQQLGRAEIAPLLEAEKHLLGECHLLRGFVRFSDYGGALAASITPKNFVLPYIASHFVNRFSGENFMIYDKTHKTALIYENRRQKIIPLEHVEFPDASPQEKSYRELWKRFYNTVAIESRYNPRCRMTHMPKRYWENMTEMQE
ncbi:MAG: TIGR03915 family putative DNA repair protein [Clostridiales bacterium]|nr:TIGR03915 family putative DNA repair protein [Clostridiales bacterium]